jgi:hypothetical protein
MNWEILFNPPYDIFTIVALFTLGISVLEIFSVIFGFSLSKLFSHGHDLDFHAELKADHLFDFHGSHLHHVELDSGNFVNLFNLGQVPFLLILLSLTGFFAFFGLGTHLVSSHFSFQVPNLAVVPLSIGLSSFFTYKVSTWWKKIFPNIETYAVSGRSLVGRVGMVNLGTASYDNGVEIAVYDEHNSKHYVMARVAIKDTLIQQNEKVMIVHNNADGSYLILPFIEKSKAEDVVVKKLEMNS